MNLKIRMKCLNLKHSEQTASIKDIDIEPLTSSENLKQIVRQLEDIHSNPITNHPSANVTFKNDGVLIKLKTPNG